jgi:hypothetical protein
LESNKFCDRVVFAIPGSGAIFREIAPQVGIEWLLTIDLVELSWDIQRYGLLRHKALESYRQRAIEQTLRRIDCAGIPAAFEQAATLYTKQNASRL